MNAVQLLPCVRDMFSHHPEMIGLEAYHLQWTLYALHYTDELEDEGEIAAAVQTALTDTTGEAA
jgi:hypothetical protein